MHTKQTPILIVGGGADGLTASMLSRREIGPQGAVLVRPDRFIAWANMGSSEHAAEELAGALGRVLAWPVGSLALTS